MNTWAVSETAVSGVLKELPHVVEARSAFHAEPKIDPAPVDMRPFSGVRREQQLTTKACVAFAFAKAMEVWNQIHQPIGAPLHDISRLLLWYMVRQLNSPNGPVENSGVALSTQVRVIEELGLLEEEAWPWGYSDIYRAPPLAILQRAFVNRLPVCPAQPILVEGAARLAAIHSALQRRFPVVFSYGMPTKWLAYSSINPFCHGILDEVGHDTDFYHAMVILGYDPTTEAFIIENSFGSLWGHEGFAYFSPRLITEGPTHGYWVVQRGPRWAD